MVRYLADLLGGWGARKPSDEQSTKSGYASALGGSGTVGRTNLLDPDPTFYDDAGAYSETASMAPLRMGGFPMPGAPAGSPGPYRTPVPPAIAGQARGMAGLDAARLAPVTPGAPAHGSAGWLPPGERGGGPGVSPPMGGPQAGSEGQPRPLLPSGQPPRLDFLSQAGGSSRDLLSGAGRWLNAPIMGQEHGTSRMMAIGQLLSGVGAGMANGGGIGGGIQGLNRSIAGIRQGEQERGDTAYKRELARLELALKQRELEQGLKPKLTTVAPGSTVLDETGKPVFTAPDKANAVKTAQEAILSGTPEQAAIGRELMALEQQYKNAMTPAEQQRIQLEGRRLQVQLAELGVSQQRAAREAADPGKMVEVQLPDGRIVLQPERTAAGMTPAPKEQDLGKVASDLRGEVVKLTAEDQKAANFYARMKGGFEQQSGAGDMAGIYAFMKLQDPNSTVMEGEYAKAENTPQWSEQMRTLYNKAIDGELITPARRAEFTKAAAAVLGPNRERFTRLTDEYTRLAKKRGVDPADVVGAAGTFPAQDQFGAAPAAPGTPDPYEGLQ